MAGSNNLTIMLIDSNRFFLEGILSLLKKQYPQVTLRYAGRRLIAPDILFVALDRVSVCTAKPYAARMGAGSRVLLIHESVAATRKSIPSFLRQHQLIHMQRRQPQSEFSAVIARLIAEKQRSGSELILNIIDKKSVNTRLLTRQEKVLVEHLRGTCTPDEIAHDMALKPKTISGYKRSVMSKLGMQNKLEFCHWLLYSE